MSPHDGVSSYLAFSPLPLRAVVFCGTCCRRLRRLPVRKYGALCCPDFPHADSSSARDNRLSGCKNTKKILTIVKIFLMCCFAECDAMLMRKIHCQWQMRQSLHIPRSGSFSIFAAGAHYNLNVSPGSGITIFSKPLFFLRNFAYFSCTFFSPCTMNTFFTLSGLWHFKYSAISL